MGGYTTTPALSTLDTHHRGLLSSQPHESVYAEILLDFHEYVHLKKTSRISEKAVFNIISLLLSVFVSMMACVLEFGDR